MRGTDTRIGPSTQLLAATIAAGFASVAAVLALALTGSFLVTLVAGSIPMAALLLGALDFTTTPDPIRESIDDSSTQMIADPQTDGGIDDK
jgi:hypothetical protein